MLKRAAPLDADLSETQVLLCALNLKKRKRKGWLQTQVPTVPLRMETQDCLEIVGRTVLD